MAEISEALLIASSQLRSAEEALEREVLRVLGPQMQRNHAELRSAVPPSEYRLKDLITARDLSRLKYEAIARDAGIPVSEQTMLVRAERQRV